MGKRLRYIDAIAGIMITWMVLGHCSGFSHFKLPFYKFLGFFMPWFYYKSGMFFNQKNKNDLIRKDIGKLLKPFIYFSLLGSSIWSICVMIDDGTRTPLKCVISVFHSFIIRGCFEGNGALWFLLSLFLVREFANVIIHRNLSIHIFMVICFLLGFGLYYLGWYNYSWWMGNVFSGLFFFLSGYWLKDKEKSSALIIVAVVVFLIFIIGHCTKLIDFPYLYMHANKMNNGNYVLFYPMAVAGIIVSNNLFRIIYANSNYRFIILEYIGRNSMNIYVTHWILFVLVSFIAKSLLHIESAAILFYCFLAASIIFLPIICYFMNKIGEQNKMVK